MGLRQEQSKVLTPTSKLPDVVSVVIHGKVLDSIPTENKVKGRECQCVVYRSKERIVVKEIVCDNEMFYFFPL